MATVPYQLAVDGVGALRVHSLQGKEALSEFWQFDVVVSGASSEEAERLALGQRATLVVDVAQKPRGFYGVVAAIKLDEAHAIDREVKYIIRIVPRLWLLRRNKRTRIFQNKRVPDIVNAVLLETNISVRWALIRGYPTREYCTQYEESDYDFVRRILAEAGIYFYFFTGEPVADSALEVNTATGLAAQVGGAALGMALGSSAGGSAGSAIQMAQTLTPGDTLVCADDALCYPSVAGDDPAALAASTVASLSPTVAEAIGGASAGAAAGMASAVAGSVIAAATRGTALGVHYMPNEHAAISTYDKLIRFGLRNSVRPAGGAFRDYDPERPLVHLQSVGVSTAPFPPSPMEIAATAAAAAENAVSAVSLVATETSSDANAAAAAANEVGDVATQIANVARVNSELYEHHSPFLFPKWAFAADAAPLILRQARRRASIGDGEGGCYDFSPGHCFDLHGHLAPQLDAKYVLTKVRHFGEAEPGSGGRRNVIYYNTFECAPAEMTYPPKRPKRRSVQVALTATVVGPKGSEIHVDDRGQIKVEFHWDRAGKRDDNSSCWIRNMQAWGGAGWGHQFIPRVGMEVVVVFAGGDPDKPMVLGSLYNETHPASFKLPEQKTRSGIRTQTTPGGNGFNELSFDDESGAEQVYVHAQRDLNEVVERNHGTDVRADQSVGIGVDQKIIVGNDRNLKVGNDLIEDIGRTHTENVRGDSKLNVTGSRGANVTGDDSLNVKGSRSLGVDGSVNIQVGLQHRIMAGDPKQPGQINHFSWGSLVLGAKERVVLSAQGGLLFQCGENTIEMNEDGVQIRAKNIKFNAKEKLVASAKGPEMVLDESLQLTSKSIKIISSKASVVLGDDAHIDGKEIKLNCKGMGAEAGDDPTETPPTQKLHLVLTDNEGNAYAGKEYVISAEGRMFEGTTGSDGGVEEDIPAEATKADVLLFLEQRPDGPKRRYSVSLGEVPAVDTVRGALMRLRNLGYYWGPITDELKRAGVDAIKRFQREQKQKITGELDAETRAALSDRHHH